MKIKKMDITIILILLVASLAMVFVTKNMTSKANGDYLVIELDGREYGRYDLSKNQKIEVKSQNGGLNTIEIKDNKATMVYANCLDLICTRMPPISDKGQTIVCLPHRLFLEVESNKESEIDQVVQ
ncbi:MAG: NusG domain II-containing protein [Porphyromonadaceae bacterium]|nr:NusG domain II-containing protein [Porphyromonadaceae bacterium]